MRKHFLLLSASILSFLLLSACSSLIDIKQSKENLSEDYLNLASKAYRLIEKPDLKTSVFFGLESALRKNGTSQAGINRLLNKNKPKTPDEIDVDLQRQVGRILDSVDNSKISYNKDKTYNKINTIPDLQKALTTSRAINKLESKITILLRIADRSPKNTRLQLLHEIRQNITQYKPARFFYVKRNHLIDLAKLYLESGDKKNASEVIASSHELLIRNTSLSNAIDFGKVADLESQLGVKPNKLCKLTRFLHKIKHQPIAWAKITAAYVKHGYQGKICLTDEKLLNVLAAMPIPTRYTTEKLELAEAWYGQESIENANRLYKIAIKSVQSIKKMGSDFKKIMQGKVMVSLLKTKRTDLYKNVREDYWSNKNTDPYSQTQSLMQLSTDAYIGGLPELSLDVLSKMRDHSSKVNAGLSLVSMAHKKGDRPLAVKALNEVFKAPKTELHPVPKMDWLRYVIDSAEQLKEQTVITPALKIAENSLDNVSHLDLKMMYAILFSNKAWGHKDYKLSEKLLDKAQLMHEDALEKQEPAKSGKKRRKSDYQVESNNNRLIDFIKIHILLGQNKKAMTIMDSLPSKDHKTKAIVLAAMTLAKKHNIQRMSKTDRLMFNLLEKKLQSLRDETIKENSL